MQETLDVSLATVDVPADSLTFWAAQDRRGAVEGEGLESLLSNTRPVRSPMSLSFAPDNLTPSTTSSNTLSKDTRTLAPSV